MSLIVTAVGGLSEDLELVLGWTHGFGWILLCLLVANGCRLRIFPWPLLAATVSPSGRSAARSARAWRARRQPADAARRSRRRARSAPSSGRSPQVSIEHQRRLWFFVVSRKSQRQRPQNTLLERAACGEPDRGVDERPAAPEPGASSQLHETRPPSSTRRPRALGVQLGEPASAAAARRPRPRGGRPSRAGRASRAAASAASASAGRRGPPGAAGAPRARTASRSSARARPGPRRRAHELVLGPGSPSRSPPSVLTKSSAGWPRSARTVLPSNE